MAVVITSKASFGACSRSATPFCSGLKPFVPSRCLVRGVTDKGASHHRKVHAQALETQTSYDNLATKTIDNLDTDYCDDFECTSSPAIEQTVRSIARDLQRCRNTISLFQKDAKYSDGFRSFTGPAGYGRQKWVAENIQKPNVTIVKLRMRDKGTAEIEWRLTGTLAVLPVDISAVTVLELNLLTGRVATMKETWNLSKCGAPAAALATLNRFAWSAKQAVLDAKDGLSQATSKLSKSLGLGDDQSDDMSTLPGDPTKFYQQQNNANNDYVAVAFLVALLYLAFKAFGELEKLN